jgi:hypothetical protein
LESRNVTYDRSMRKLAKPLPLDTPTKIELAPGYNIQVTLLDANHCVGAVMFLIEGNGKAILYTGDIRAEPWWVNSLVQNPVLLPYALGHRRLDCMYLDTTFATKKEPYRQFPSKAEGLGELLNEVGKYPEDTVFYFHSWTFGYENVWIALSSFLGSRIHLDNYRARIYGSLSTLDKKQLREAGLDVSTDNKALRDLGLEIREAPALCGFRNGNHIQPGCLTSRESVRIHSCERGTGCRVMSSDADVNIVHIIPIITRSNGLEIAELGAGGGKGDLDQKEELETGGAAEIGRLMELCAASIEDEELLARVLTLLHQTLNEGNTRLELDMQHQRESSESQDDVSLHTLVTLLSAHASKDKEAEQPRGQTIRFPYSRHSSYLELCGLVETLKPKDVFPCTVDDNTWTPEVSMRNLFGHLCSGHVFRHDKEMLKLYKARLEHALRVKRDREETQNDSQATDGDVVSPIAAKHARPDETATAHVSGHRLESDSYVTPITTFDGAMEKPTRSGNTCFLNAIPVTNDPTAIAPNPVEQPFPVPAAIEVTRPTVAPLVSSPTATTSMQSLISSMAHAPPEHRKTRRRKPEFTNRELAYQAAIGIDLTWSDFGGLVSSRSKADREEGEL